MAPSAPDETPIPTSQQTVAKVTRAAMVLGLVAVVSSGSFTRVKDPGLAELAEWRAPTANRVLAGDVSYYGAGLLERVARYRGLDVSRYRDGVALMRAGDLGRAVWIFWPDGSGPLGGAWRGPYLSVDCSNRAHYAGNLQRGRVAEVSRQEWIRLGMPDRPVPVVVSFVEPWPAAMVPR